MKKVLAVLVATIALAGCDATTVNVDHNINTCKSATYNITMKHDAANGRSIESANMEEVIRYIAERECRTTIENEVFFAGDKINAIREHDKFIWTKKPSDKDIAKATVNLPAVIDLAEEIGKKIALQDKAAANKFSTEAYNVK